MVTSKDIARELNLSQPTVSRILNGDESHRASEATRARVWEVAQRLGYQPNALARSLRRGRTDIIGVHTGLHYDVRNDFLGTIVGALQSAGARHHLDVLLHSGADRESAQAMFGKLRDGRVDGLILHSSADDPLVELLNHSPFPVVAVADRLLDLPAVVSDDERGMAGLIELLWARGHRQFRFLAPRLNLPSVEKRAQVFKRELEKRGVEPLNRQVQRIEFEQAEVVLPELRAQGPLAVCCWNDLTAFNLLDAAIRAGIKVPGELAIAGFDGLRVGSVIGRRLTTVRCPWEDVATRALDILIELIEHRSDKPREKAGRVVLLRPEVLPGDTA